MKILNFGLLLIIVALVPASAKDLVLADADQQNMLAVCARARTNPNLTDEEAAGIATWCLNFRKRIEANNAATPPPPPPPGQ